MHLPLLHCFRWLPKSPWCECTLNTVVPNLFGMRDQFQGRQFFHGWGGGRGFGVIHVHYIYCVLCYYYYYISFTSDHQALDPRGQGPLI